MAFDQATRNRLQRFVSDARTLLTKEFTRQLQEDYGITPNSGEVAAMETLSYLDNVRRETARILRVTLEHYRANSPGSSTTDLLERIVREQAFTVLNRLAALRMAEAREFITESIAKGYESRGFQLYLRLAGTGLGETGDAYRSYLFSLFDEFALDLQVLFDRFSPMGRLFPSEPKLLDLLKLMNDPEVADLWAEDETIGWIYQYFNSKDERKKMRDESAAPRNSRELAVRNQFFTPRYVVEFLTDNTLGRIWYEMTQGETALKDRCRYLVRRPNEIFLQEGAVAPESPEAEASLSQEELLKQPVYIPHRSLKDPREIRMLDPACGSMHFGLYAFDLYECIYEEAWDLEERGISFQRGTGREPLTATYASKEAFLRDVPRLIIEHNIHGVDIDPRAVQIAGLSLWLRAQKSWQSQELKLSARPQIQKSNVVCAEPMPGAEQLLNEFLEQHLADTPEQQLIGHLVRRVFEAMKLAGEAGSLLQIEQEISKDVEEARLQWLNRPKSEQLTLSVLEAEPKQQELPLMVSEITDAYFWERVEEEIYKALNRYAEQVEGKDSYQRRMFTNDAARGFAFIDLCRKSYDFILMNPPFGEPSKRTRNFLNELFPKTSNDLFATFTERAISLLEDQGLIGEISSRVGFFIKSFQEWRTKILETNSVENVIDLGFGVLDGAAVETAAYTVRKVKAEAYRPKTLIFRLLLKQEKDSNLYKMIRELYDQQTYIFDSRKCHVLPLSPWVYWISSKIRLKLTSDSCLEPEGALVRQGLGTGDNNRFIRLLWEVPQSLIATQRGTNADFSQQFYSGKRWALHVRSGSSQPWYSPLTVVIDWENGGRRLKELWISKGEAPSRYIPSESLYFKPGFSWTRRAFRLIPYLIPAGCIPSASRYMGFPKDGSEYSVIALVASNIATCFMRFYGEMFERPNHLVDTLKRLPYKESSIVLKDKLEQIVKEEVAKRRFFFRNYEPYWDFVLPSSVQPFSDNQGLNWNPSSLLGRSLDIEVASLYSLNADELKELEFDLEESIQIRDKNVISEDDTGDNSDDDLVFDTSEKGRCIDTLSYCLGIVYGRWDVRFATGEKPVPRLPDPFEPLPSCPPGMLQNDQGLPAAPQDISPKYPLQVNWNGILVDDEGHPNDIIRDVRQVLKVIWGNKDSDIEQEACEILKVSSLRDYFRKPAAFFNDHLTRYSKSRRQAPIYLPLSTASGSYTLWLYYHRLTDQTLYTCINDYVEPKLSRVSETVKFLRSKTTRTRDEENNLEDLQTLEDELTKFRDELLRVAKLPWKPNLNDGVQITVAPLHSLFRLSKWQKKLKETWDKLEKGDYDWAHLAYSIRTAQVREKCRTDKSLAIAHGLEDLYEPPPETPKRNKSRRKADS